LYEPTFGAYFHPLVSRLSITEDVCVLFALKQRTSSCCLAYAVGGPHHKEVEPRPVSCCGLTRRYVISVVSR
jgi:hypothetical protein